MKFSCLAVSLFPDIMGGRMSVGGYASLCRGLGLDGFDLGITVLKNHTPVYLQALNQEIEGSGLPLVMVTASPDLSNPHPLQREREYDFLLHDIALASALNARFLRATAGQAHPGVNAGEIAPIVAEYLMRASKAAEKYGIEVLFENHSTTKAWQYMDIANPSAVFLDIAARIKDSAIGINFDTANILVAGEDNTIEVLDAVISKVKTIHVADMAKKGSMAPVQLGTGIVPMRDIFKYLKEKKFDGWLCLEIWKDEGAEAVKRAVDDMKELWEKA